MDATGVLRTLLDREETLAVAESLTGGLLSSAFVDVPGASAVFRGGLVVYATELKSTIGGVPLPLLTAHGPVDPEVAAALARGASARCGADWGLAVTGVAGPTPQGGQPVGRVFVAVAGPGGGQVRALDITGDRGAVRRGAVDAAIGLLADSLARAA